MNNAIGHTTKSMFFLIVVIATGIFGSVLAEPRFVNIPRDALINSNRSVIARDFGAKTGAARRSRETRSTRYEIASLLHSSRRRPNQRIPSADEAVRSGPLIENCNNSSALKTWYERYGHDGALSGLKVLQGGLPILTGENALKESKSLSVSKSIAALLAGHYLRPSELDSPVAHEISELESDYPAVTWRHLLTMTSGYDASGGSIISEAPGRADYTNTPQIPTSPMFEPGSRFGYWTDSYLLLGYLIESRAGKSLGRLFQERIREPLSLETGTYQELKSRLPHGQVSDAGGGLHISANDLAKIGNALTTDSSSIVPRAWFDEMTSLQVSAEFPAWKYSHEKYDGRGTYGLGWWINGITPGGERKWRDLPELAFAARGARRNFLYVEPESDLVVARINQDKKSIKRQPSDQYMNTLMFSLKRALAQCEKKNSSFFFF